MNRALKYRLRRTALLCTIAMLIGAGTAWWQVNNRTAAVTQKPSTPAPMVGVKVGGPYELVNQYGQTVTDKDFAGRPKLIYFGFTYCPAICPTELQKIMKTLNTLGKDGESIQPLFITIDPERDTVPVIKNYVRLFHPRLIGLTGSRTQIDNTLKAYRVYAQKVPTEDGVDYTMDHSSFIYLMDEEDSLLAMYGTDDDADMMTTDIKKRLEQ